MMHSIEQNVNLNKRKCAPKLLKTKTMKSYGKKAKTDKEEQRERKTPASKQPRRAQKNQIVEKEDKNQGSEL